MGVSGQGSVFVGGHAGDWRARRGRGASSVDVNGMVDGAEDLRGCVAGVGLWGYRSEGAGSDQSKAQDIY